MTTLTDTTFDFEITEESEINLHDFMTNLIAEEEEKTISRILYLRFCYHQTEDLSRMISEHLLAFKYNEAFQHLITMPLDSAITVTDISCADTVNLRSHIEVLSAAAENSEQFCADLYQFTSSKTVDDLCADLRTYLKCEYPPHSQN